MLLWPVLLAALLVMLVVMLVVALRGSSLRDTAVPVEGQPETMADTPRLAGAVRGGAAALGYTIR